MKTQIALYHKYS